VNLKNLVSIIPALFALGLTTNADNPKDFTAHPKVTPAEWVRQQPPPRFKPGHTLPHLGQMHCINPPVELRAELARNALFTWIETDLRNSHLLPGPEPHAWDKEQPAYEFPTGHKNTRVLVRRVNNAPRWLIGAWAADGIEREVTVTVPDLGECRIPARSAGTVHWVEQIADKRTATWLDETAMKPSLKGTR
jgi:hypothetical protein